VVLVRWLLFVLFAIACFLHTGFVTLGVAGIWWGAQKAFCPDHTVKALLVFYSVPTAVAILAALSRRSKFTASIPFMAWFGCWSVVLVSVVSVISLAPYVPGLIPYCDFD